MNFTIVSRGTDVINNNFRVKFFYNNNKQIISTKVCYHCNLRISEDLLINLLKNFMLKNPIVGSSVEFEIYVNNDSGNINYDFLVNELGLLPFITVKNVQYHLDSIGVVAKSLLDPTLTSNLVIFYRDSENNKIVLDFHLTLSNIFKPSLTDVICLLQNGCYEFNNKLTDMVDFFIRASLAVGSPITLKKIYDGKHIDFLCCINSRVNRFANSFKFLLSESSFNDFISENYNVMLATYYNTLELEQESTTTRSKPSF